MGIKTGITTAWNNIKTTVSTALNNIKTAVTTAWNGIKTTVSTTLNNIKSAVTTAWNNIKSSVTTAMNNIDDAISEATDGFTDYVDESIGGVEDTISDLTGIPTVDDYQEDMSGLLDDIYQHLTDPDYEYADDPQTQTMLEELEQIMEDLDGADSYSDLDEVVEEITEFLIGYEDYLDDPGTGDYDSWLDQTGDIGGGIGSAEEPQSVYGLQSTVDSLQNDIMGLQSQVLDLETRISQLESSAADEQWIHQIDGSAVSVGTVNFVTNV